MFFVAFDSKAQLLTHSSHIFWTENTIFNAFYFLPQFLWSFQHFKLKCVFHSTNLFSMYFLIFFKVQKVCLVNISIIILLLKLSSYHSYRDKAIESLGKLTKVTQLIAGMEHSVESTSFVLNIQSVLVDSFSKLGGKWHNRPKFTTLCSPFFLEICNLRLSMPLLIQVKHIHKF